MKLIHFRDEFGKPFVMKAVCYGIFWNEYMEAWSVHTQWGHATCTTISQAKRLFRSRFSGEYMTLKDGTKFPIFKYPEVLKGGYNRKENHIANSLFKAECSHKDRDTIKRFIRIDRKMEKRHKK